MKSVAKPSTRNQLRIISGKWRGRKLDFPSIDGLRPTGDRIRETLFNWLAPYIPDSRCLDLFSGSGALGLEAASRGAATVLLMDNNKQAAAQLKENIAKLQADNVELACCDAMSWLQNTTHQKPFDIIFLDPPFEQHLFGEAISLLNHSSVLTEKSLVYLETPRDYQFSVPHCWTQIKEKQAGHVSFYLYQCGE